MHNFKIGFNFVKDFLYSNLKFGRILGRNVKIDFIFKYKSIFTFNDTGIDTHRFDKKWTIII